MKCGVLGVFLVGCTSFPAATIAEDLVLFSDSFADVKGRIVTQTDGKIEATGVATRRVAPFMGTSQTAVGKLTIVALEDPATPGFDEKPGVLALSFKTLPTAATYCGFAYLGGMAADRAMKLKELSEAPNLENLKQIKLKFRYKATNPLDVAATGASYGCRLEPLVDNSYNSRIAFPVLQATDKWQTFETTLDRGQNIESFLKTISMVAPPGFKLVFAQTGPITGYQPGDTLLVDDIEIVRLSPK